MMRSKMLGFRKINKLKILFCLLMVGQTLFAQKAQLPLSPNTSAIQSIHPVANKTVMEIISSDPSLSKFTAAIYLAHLDTLLNYANPITLFIPSNTALGAVPPQLMHALYNPANLSKLQGFIKKHIVRLNIQPSMLANLKTRDELGKTLYISSRGNDFVLNEKAKIILPPIEASNGFIYLINTPIISD